MEISVKYIGDDLHIAVMDENKGKDWDIGEATIKLSSLCDEFGHNDEWFLIKYRGDPAGHIHISSEW